MWRDHCKKTARAVTTVFEQEKTKQAVVILHRMGEQIPMETLVGFVKTVWATDESLVDRGKPDPNTGKGNRTANASWGKPNTRTRSFELRRITREATRNGRYVDFLEFYWADLMEGTTWEHVQSWILDLLLRNPWRRVPLEFLQPGLFSGSSPSWWSRSCFCSCFLPMAIPPAHRHRSSTVPIVCRR